MALKPYGKDWTIKEQVVEDEASGLTLQFEVGDGDGLCRLRIYGDLPSGNRDFIFDTGGVVAGAGTALAGFCRPSWLREVPQEADQREARGEESS